MPREAFLPQRVDGPTQATPFPSAGGSGTPEFRAWRLDGANPDASAESEESARRQLHEQAREEGRREGLEQAQREVAEASEAMLGQWKQTLESITTLHQQLTEGYRQELAQLSVQVGEALVQHQIDEGRDIAKGLVEKALEELGVEEEMHVTLSVQDTELLRPWLESLSAGGAGLSIQTDPALGPGDLRVRSESGSVESLMADRISRVRCLVLGPNAESESEA